MDPSAHVIDLFEQIPASEPPSPLLVIYEEWFPAWRITLHWDTVESQVDVFGGFNLHCGLSIFFIVTADSAGHANLVGVAEPSASARL